MAIKPQTAEIQPGPGFRVKLSKPTLPDSLIKEFAVFPTADISDAQNRLYTMSSDIKNIVNRRRLIGVACTVKVYPGDNLMVHESLDIAKPGDVIVVDVGGHKNTAVFGDLVASKAKHLGIAGFIIDGLTRDLEKLREVDIPVFTLGTTPIGPLHRGPGEVNYPVSCGGIVVNPGDLIIADDDGVVVVRNEMAEEIAARLKRQDVKLSDYVARVKKGDFSNEWVQSALRDAGCIYEP
jgi:RraA family protein